MVSRHANVFDAFVAERIRAYRKQAGLSQSQLGEKLGLTFQQIQKYEKGVNRVGAGRLFEIARIFHVPIQALYPLPDETIEGTEHQTEDLKAISNFIANADGWRLCQSFLRIPDAQRRKRIVALVQELAEL